jgi:hypothetical protein
MKLMTEAEEFFTEKYEENRVALLKGLMQQQKVLSRLVQHLLEADMNVLEMNVVKASLNDAFITVNELDNHCDGESDSKVKELLRLFEEVETEIKGDVPEPMGGTKPSDYA